MDDVSVIVQVLGGVQAMSVWEGVAALLAIAYVILAINERIECWYAALGSTMIYTVLFWNVNLLMESGLQVYYIGMAVYGWFQWRRHSPGVDKLKIRMLAISTHVWIILGVAVMTLVSGYLLTKNTNAALPYLDSFTTWASVVTTYLVAKKVLENWLYWIVIDVVSIFLYVDRGMLFTAVLFVIYTGMAVIGYWKWRKSFSGQSTA